MHTQKTQKPQQLFLYPFIITEIKIDEERKIAQLRVTGNTPIQKKELIPGTYADESTQLNGFLELPVAMVYTGNHFHRVLRPEFKQALGNTFIMGCEEQPVRVNSIVSLPEESTSSE